MSFHNRWIWGCCHCCKLSLGNIITPLMPSIKYVLQFCAHSTQFCILETVPVTESSCPLCWHVTLWYTNDHILAWPGAFLLHFHLWSCMLQILWLLFGQTRQGTISLLLSATCQCSTMSTSSAKDKDLGWTEYEVTPPSGTSNKISEIGLAADMLNPDSDL